VSAPWAQSRQTRRASVCGATRNLDVVDRPSRIRRAPHAVFKRVVGHRERETDGVSRVRRQVDDRIQVRLWIAAPAWLALQGIAAGGGNDAVVRIGQEAVDNLRLSGSIVRRDFEQSALDA